MKDRNIINLSLEVSTQNRLQKIHIERDELRKLPSHGGRGLRGGG
jgi:hypothetical protein